MAGPGCPAGARGTEIRRLWRGNFLRSRLPEEERASPGTPMPGSGGPGCQGPSEVICPWEDEAASFAALEQNSYAMQQPAPYLNQGTSKAQAGTGSVHRRR